MDNYKNNLQVLWKISTMKCINIIFILCLHCSKSSSYLTAKPDSMLIPKSNVTEPKIWNLKLDIYFTKSLNTVMRKKVGNKLKMKCEAIMNFTSVEKYTKSKERVETSLKDVPSEHIQTLMKNVKVYWLKDNQTIPGNLNVNITTKMDLNNGTIGSILVIKSLEKTDEGLYTCVIKQNYEKKQHSKLVVLSDGEDNASDEVSLLSTSIDGMQTTLISDSFSTSFNESQKEKYFENIESFSTAMPQVLNNICQEYVGNVCAAHLKAKFVYIPYNTTQAQLEDKLYKAIQVTKYSKDISSLCHDYALPSLCYSTFPICREPFLTNENFLKEIKQLYASFSNKSQGIINGEGKPDKSEVQFENLSQFELPTKLDMNLFLNVTGKNLSDIFNYRHNSTILRRVCKRDCEILENELCQTEYAIAKRHPHIGQQLTLEECEDLPETDKDCLKIGIRAVMAEDDKCFWENGNTYLGRVNVANNGMPCIEWSKQLIVKPAQYPELAGRHSYCRNPGGTEIQPWCIIDLDGRLEKQLCDIPKCAYKIWIYIIIVFLFITFFILGFILYMCYKSRHKNKTTTIRNINLPNADKNIYGDSRLNSPIEMSDLLSNQNTNFQPNTNRSVRGNGVLRIPQYSLSQIKFLEELGEGAFGKVYKGALNCGGEVMYVAVKALKENASAKTKADFRREIDLISELRHDNIVAIVGVALREEPLCMLFEFMARGDLHEFLMGRAPPSGKGLPSLRLLNIAYNIASGMQYLASHHYVHRDLAARNCLVSDDFIVKISDFGLSRDIYSSDYYRVQSKSLLPVRWMPPESILYGKFTTESDIWSYGIVLWEIYSYGLQPYYGYSNQEVIAMVRGGELLACPTGCPSSLFGLMRDCWRHAPHTRPTFEDIVNRLQTWIQMGGCPDNTASESSNTCTHRQPTERMPLLTQCSSSNGSLVGGSLKKLNITSSNARIDDNCSTCSDIPPTIPRSKKGSCGSLLDSDRPGPKDTVVRIPNTQFGNEI